MTDAQVRRVRGERCSATTPPSRVARRYAEALIDAAQKEGQADAVLDELEEIDTDVLGRFPGFAAILASDRVPAAEKDRILTDVFEGRASSLVLRFLRVLNRHGRLGLLGPIVREARAIWDRREPPHPGVGPLGRPARRGPDARPSATGSRAWSPARRS